MGAYRIRVPVRWVDLDAQGHVNNAAIVDYLQEAHIHFLLNSPYAHFLSNGIVVAHQVEYVRPVWFGDADVAVDVRVGKVDDGQVLFGYEVSQGTHLVARARTLLANFDSGANQLARFTAGERAWFDSQSEGLAEFAPLPRFRVGEGYHLHPVTVRWSDVDASGCVNHARLFDYLAEARVALKEPLIENAITGSGGQVEHTWMVVRQDVRYVGRLRHRLSPHEVHTAIGRLGRTSMTLAADIVDPGQGEVLASATTVLVHGDAEGRPQRLPVEMLDAAAVWKAVDDGPGPGSEGSA